MADSFRVLVVDDDRRDLKKHQEILEHLGCEVLTADSPEGGLISLMANESKSIDIAFIDLMMQGDATAGVRLARALKTLDPGIMTVLVATHLGVDGLFDAKIQKPLRSSEVEQLVADFAAAVASRKKSAEHPR